MNHKIHTMCKHFLVINALLLLNFVFANNVLASEDYVRGVLCGDGNDFSAGIPVVEENADANSFVMAGKDLLLPQNRSVTYTFTNELEDTTPPQVIYVYPADGATGVPINQDRIDVRFNEDMDRQSLLEGGTIYFTDSDGNIMRVNFRMWFDDGLELQFYYLLEPNATYYVHVTTNAKDLAGNNLAEEFISSFTTAPLPPDNDPPVVSYVYPADGATGVPINQDRIDVRFNEDMDRQSLLEGGTIYFTDSDGNIMRVNFRMWFDDGLELQFYYLLEPNATYYVHVTTNAKDLAGNNLAEEFISSFTTAPLPPDNDPPVVSYVYPADGATGVPINQDRIDVRFNEDMDRQSLLEGGTIYFTDSDGNIMRVNFRMWFDDGLELQFYYLLEPNATYYVHVTTNASDLAGNHLAEEFVSSFTTESTNNLPIVDAGQNITISSENQVTTILLGIASDIDGDTMTYRWLENDTELSSWQDVIDGNANLNLGNVPLFSIGQYTLTLEVSDGTDTVKDDMILTVGNSAPHAAPSGSGVYEVNTEVILGGSVSDFDGDTVHYEWMDGAILLNSGTIECIKEGAPVLLPSYSTWNLSLGTHTLVLIVNDGVNEPVINEITIQVVDTGVPTLAPVCNQQILWPPNHQLTDIFIEANASDESGLPVTLDVVISSNEPENGLGDGDMAPDWTQPIIDQELGTIGFKLRSERSGSGEGREYTIAITCTDLSGNSSTANVTIIVPHDKKK